MTDRPVDETPDKERVPVTHPSDEDLSSRIDREPTPGMQPGELDAHLGECGRCRARLARLERARDLVATPVRPVERAHRDHDVTIALESVDRTRPARRGVLVATAAAVVVVVIAGALTFGLHNHGTQTNSTASNALGAMPTQPTVSVLGDLGSINSPRMLRSKLTVLIKSNFGSPTRASAHGNVGALTQTLPSRCRATTSALSGQSTYPLYAYKLTYNGVRALALVITPNGSRPPISASTSSSAGSNGTTQRSRAVVLAIDGCRILADVPL